jgi:hypothetical protein
MPWRWEPDPAIALTVAGFRPCFGFNPDLEIPDSDPAVPVLIDDLARGDLNPFFQLGNIGDEMILRDPSGLIVDAIAYGRGAVPGTIACPLAPAPGYSLERLPYWRDSNDCPADFRPWPLPNPGALP